MDLVDILDQIDSNLSLIERIFEEFKKFKEKRFTKVLWNQEKHLFPFKSFRNEISAAKIKGYELLSNKQFKDIWEKSNKLLDFYNKKINFYPENFEEDYYIIHDTEFKNGYCQESRYSPQYFFELLFTIISSLSKVIFLVDASTKSPIVWQKRIQRIKENMISEEMVKLFDFSEVI